MANFRYFTLKEMCASEKAEKKGIDNYPSFTVVEHLSELVENILEPLRDAWGGPIYVTSGYRCEALNKAVGGVATSVHKLGWAADLQPARGRYDEFKTFVKAWLVRNRVRFDQCIEETDGGERWIHIGLKSSTGSQRGQFLNIVK